MPLKPCKYCGAEEKHLVMMSEIVFCKSEQERYLIACKKCTLTGPSAKTQRGAKIIWNKQKFKVYKYVRGKKKCIME